MSDQLYEALDSVTDEASFLRFVEMLQADRQASEDQPVTPDGFQGEWANQTIGSFLSAAIAWAEDSGFGVRPGPKPSNHWSLFAHFLYAGRGYE